MFGFFRNRAFSIKCVCCNPVIHTSHFALKANMADLSAKENAQETAVNVCGMVSIGLLSEWYRRFCTLLYGVPPTYEYRVVDDFLRFQNAHFAF